MRSITKTQPRATSYHDAVAHLALKYFQENSDSISLVSKEDWPEVNAYFVNRGITKAKLRRVLDHWPGPGWIEFVPSSFGIDAVWRAPHEPDAFGITRNEM
jgi:hypothetical protein